MRDPNRAEARCAEQGLQVSFPRGLALAGGAPPTGDGVCQAGRRPSPSSQSKNSGAVGKRTQREGPWGTPASRFVLALATPMLLKIFRRQGDEYFVSDIVVGFAEEET